VHSRRLGAVAAVAFTLALLAGCSVADIEVNYRGRIDHEIETVAVLPGRLSAGVAAAIDSTRFEVVGPALTDELLAALEVERWDAVPGPEGCGLLREAGVDAVIWSGSPHTSSWCRWLFASFTVSTHTCKTISTIQWCQSAEKGRGAIINAVTGPDSTALDLIGRALGTEVSKQLRRL